MQPGTKLSSQQVSTYLHSSQIKLLFASVDDHRSIRRVERVIQTTKQRLGVMRTDKNKTAIKLDLDVAEIIKTSPITPHGIILITPFEAIISRKTNYPLSNIKINSSSNNLFLGKPQTRLFRSEKFYTPSNFSARPPKKTINKIMIKRRVPEPAIIQHTPAKDSIQPSNKDVKIRRLLALEKEKLNVRYKGIQQQVQPNIKKTNKNK